MNEILGDKLNIVYEDTLLEITPELMKKTIINQNKEIERLNNIINELEKYLDEQVDYMTHHSIERMIAFDCCRHKLQELKGSDKDENK